MMSRTVTRASVSRGSAADRGRSSGRAAGIIATPGNARAIRSLTIALGTILLACVLVACAEDDPRARLQPALGSETFTQPVEVAAFDADRVFVAERGGSVWLVGGAGERMLFGDLAPLIDARLGEGLLSFALDPSFGATGHAWAYYFAADEPSRTVLARFDIRDGALDLSSELVVLELPQPGYNQNGGAIRFDSAGYLYLSVGDGSASTDPFEQGQDPTTLLATVLRLDVRDASAETPYRVPEANPFVDEDGVRPEIFAYGFRNPWRMSIDLEGDTVWLGDVGYSNAEEIDRVEAGGNYGWSVLEGTHCLHKHDCSSEGFEPPVYEFPHTEGRCAVVGGLVYRGDAIDGLGGRYLFGDLCTGQIWAMPASAQAGDDVEPLLLVDLDGMLVTFGVDAAGEVLVADYEGGGIYRLVPE